MRCFVGNKLNTAQLLIGRRILREEHLCIVVERSSSMLHTAILEAGQYHKVVLGKGVVDARKLL